jgi:excisionase family DNA binding protein
MSKPAIPTLEPLSPLGPPDPSIPQAAEMIGVSERTLRRAIERDEIEAYKLLGNTRVKLASLHLVLQRARRAAQAVAAGQTGEEAEGQAETAGLRRQRRVTGHGEAQVLSANGGRGRRGLRRSERR